MKKDFQQNDIKIKNNEEGSAEENKLTENKLELVLCKDEECMILFCHKQKKLQFPLKKQKKKRERMKY